MEMGAMFETVPDTINRGIAIVIYADPGWEGFGKAGKF